MGKDFYSITAFIALAVTTGLAILAISYYLPRLIGDVARKRGKLDPYECGVEPGSSARQRFSVKFYVVALLFILFDIETVLLIPWAVAYQGMLAEMSGTGAARWMIAEALGFIGVLAVGLLYIWRRGALDWT